MATRVVWIVLYIYPLLLPVSAPFETMAACEDLRDEMYQRMHKNHPEMADPKYGVSFECLEWIENVEDDIEDRDVDKTLPRYERSKQYAGVDLMNPDLIQRLKDFREKLIVKHGVTDYEVLSEAIDSLNRYESVLKMLDKWLMTDEGRVVHRGELQADMLVAIGELERIV